MASSRKPTTPKTCKAVESDPWAEAVAHLRSLDEKWAALIDRAGPCLLVARPDRFGTLVWLRRGSRGAGLMVGHVGSCSTRGCL